MYLKQHGGVSLKSGCKDYLLGFLKGSDGTWVLCSQNTTSLPRKTPLKLALVNTPINFLDMDDSPWINKTHDHVLPIACNTTLVRESREIQGPIQLQIIPGSVSCLRRAITFIILQPSDYSVSPTRKSAKLCTFSCLGLNYTFNSVSFWTFNRQSVL